jgi:hypothetical protein
MSFHTLLSIGAGAASLRKFSKPLEKRTSKLEILQRVQRKSRADIEELKDSYYCYSNVYTIHNCLP